MILDSPALEVNALHVTEAVRQLVNLLRQKKETKLVISPSHTIFKKTQDSKLFVHRDKESLLAATRMTKYKYTHWHRHRLKTPITNSTMLGA